MALIEGESAQHAQTTPKAAQVEAAAHRIKQSERLVPPVWHLRL